MEKDDSAASWTASEGPRGSTVCPRSLGLIYNSSLLTGYLAEYLGGGAWYGLQGKYDGKERGKGRKMGNISENEETNQGFLIFFFFYLNLNFWEGGGGIYFHPTC